MQISCRPVYDSKLNQRKSLKTVRKTRSPTRSISSRSKLVLGCSLDAVASYSSQAFLNAPAVSSIHHILQYGHDDIENIGPS